MGSTSVARGQVITELLAVTGKMKLFKHLVTTVIMGASDLTSKQERKNLTFCWCCCKVVFRLSKSSTYPSAE